MMLVEGVTVIDAWELEAFNSTSNSTNVLIVIQFILLDYNLIQICEL